MRSLWSDDDARLAIERYAADGVNEDLALRVYTTRLLGSDPQLVLHGGGNTSVKSRAVDAVGEEVDVLFVKGSGWDMGIIEPPGLPAVRIAPLLQLADVESLSDEEMVRAQRSNLLDPGAPNPSVEALLHAWVPHKFVDHTHANAVLALVDQPDGEAIVRDLYGDRMAYVPYIMPGFDLAKAAKAAADAHPDAEGLILLKHGIFSFGADAREAYERMIEFVSMAEDRIAGGPGKTFAAGTIPGTLARPADVAPLLRGLLANPLGAGDQASAGEQDDGGRPKGDGHQRFVLDFRTGPGILTFVNGAELGRYSQAGTATPDHVIRTKAKPLVVPAPEAGDLDAFETAAREATKQFRDEYEKYFARNNERVGGVKTMLDSSPRVVLVPGLGLFAAGKNAKAAAVAGDLAETAIAVISDAEGMDRFESIGEADLFDMEYWSLEQAKLGASKDPPLTGTVVAITGGAGAIGAATAAAFGRAGAEVALLDLPDDHLEDMATRLAAAAIPCDVTDDASVAAAMDAVVEAFGGLDVLVSNAGAAWQGRIGEVPDAELRESFELNFFGHQRVARAAVAVMLAQGTGGALLFNASKQALNPGPRFGPYGLPKAATLALMRQYAIDYGAEGIRSNAVNADRIRSGLLTDDMVSQRSTARGVSEQAYMSGNLLEREVTAEDVGAAFVALARARRTTGAILTVDGGNIAAAVR